MQDDGWPARMAHLVAGEVRRYRERQQPRMSAQQLSDRTGELGMLSPRSVLANLESGRRETVSAAEIMVLAAVRPRLSPEPRRIRPGLPVPQCTVIGMDISAGLTKMIK